MTIRHNDLQELSGDSLLTKLRNDVEIERKIKQQTYTIR